MCGVSASVRAAQHELRESFPGLRVLLDVCQCNDDVVKCGQSACANPMLGCRGRSGWCSQLYFRVLVGLFILLGSLREFCCIDIPPLETRHFHQCPDGVMKSSWKNSIYLQRNNSRTCGTNHSHGWRKIARPSGATADIWMRCCRKDFPAAPHDCRSIAWGLRASQWCGLSLRCLRRNMILPVSTDTIVDEWCEGYMRG